MQYAFLIRKDGYRKGKANLRAGGTSSTSWVKAPHMAVLCRRRFDLWRKRNRKEVHQGEREEAVKMAFSYPTASRAFQ
jgi:hypothetical protein